jgi:hypothetical protein
MGAPFTVLVYCRKKCVPLEVRGAVTALASGGTAPHAGCPPGHPQDAAVLTPIQATGREQPER